MSSKPLVIGSVVLGQRPVDLYPKISATAEIAERISAQKQELDRLKAEILPLLEAALLELRGARRTFRSKQVARAIASLEKLYRDLGGVPPARR